MTARHERELAAKCRRMIGGRHVLFEGVYNTLHDVVIVGREGEPSDDEGEKPALHPGYLKAGMTVMDLTDIPRTTPLMKEASLRGCHVTNTSGMLVAHVRRQVKRLPGLEMPLP